MPRLLIRVLVTGIALSTFNSPARAQVLASAGLGALMQQAQNDGWRSTTQVDPALRIDGRWAQLSTDATLLGGNQRAGLDQANLGFLVAPPAFGALGAFRITTTGNLDRLSPMPNSPRTVGDIESALSLTAGQSGGWVGLGAEAADGKSTSGARPLLRLGVWRQINGLSVTLGADQHATRVATSGRFITNRYNDSGKVVGADTSFNHAYSYLWSTLHARVGFAIRGVYFDTRAGMQQKTSVTAQTAAPSVWFNGTATAPIGIRLSLVAAAGTQSVDAWPGVTAKRFASLGVRVAPAALIRPSGPAQVRPTAASFRLEPAGSGAFVVRLRVPDARTVELSGDFDRWVPIALRQTSPDVWETTIALAPGAYHVNVRINGDRWTTPAGLPSTTDEFNGTVGLIVVR